METLIIAATDTNLTQVNNFVHKFMPDSCSTQLINQIDLAVEEIFVNIAHYAYTKENDDTKSVTIGCNFNQNELTIFFKDSGKAFNPLLREDPDLTMNADEREMGGLGIYLTKTFMDDINYEYKDNCNCLTIKKLLNA